MQALKPTQFTATVTWLGRVTDREAALASTSVEAIEATFEGIPGEFHGGALRESDSRVLEQHPRGTPIRNVRQLAILSVEELAVIARRMGLDRLDPALVGATMVVEGLEDFTHLPPSSRLQAPSGATLVVDMENRPCVLPGREIELHHKGFGKKFKPAAEGLRGVTAWVEREGRLAVGDVLRLHVPDQPAWALIGPARGAPAEAAE